MHLAQNNCILGETNVNTEMVKIDSLIKNFHAFISDVMNQSNDESSANVSISLTSSFDAELVIKDEEIKLGPLPLLALDPLGLDLLPIHLKPQNAEDPCLDNPEYWNEVENWIVKTFNVIPTSSSDKINIDNLKTIFVTILKTPEFFKENATNYIKEALRKEINRKTTEKMHQLINDVKNDVKCEKVIIPRFSSPIDPYFANATAQMIKITPIIVLDFNLVPKEIRPTGATDDRLYDLNFLQRLSDWIADTHEIPRKKVGVFEIATIKTILKLQENPLNFQKAIRSGIAHEIGHIEHEHSKFIFKNYRPSKKPIIRNLISVINSIRYLIFSIKSFLFSIKKHEREADMYAASHLEEGAEGIKIGCNKWQESLVEIRASNRFNFITRLALKSIISPKGNLLSLLFTHGSFKDRIERSSKHGCIRKN
jgi:hypothetical protein